MAALDRHGITLGTMLIPCAPTALFDYSPSVICAGINVTFTDASFFADTWNWSFPGGTPSTSADENPAVTHVSAGIYDVTLIVSNAAGSNSTTKAGIITVFPAAGQYAIPYSQSFEVIIFPGTEWAIENESGNTWLQNNLAAKTGTNSIYINNFNGNTRSTTDVFYTPSYDLSAATSNFMTFELAYATTVAASTDCLKVFVSTTCGQHWNIRYTKFGASLATAGIVTTPFVPNASQWSTQTVNIASISYNNKPNVRFKFEYLYHTGTDIFIDDINVDGTVGVNEVLEQAIGFSVYPNPVSSGATIGFTLDAAYEIYIDVVDVLGRRVNQITATRLDAGDYQFELPSTLANGLYKVRIFIEENTLTKKVLIIK